MKYRGWNILSDDEFGQVVNWLDNTHEKTLWLKTEGYRYPEEIEVKNQLALFIEPGTMYFYRTWYQINTNIFVPSGHNDKYGLMIQGKPQQITYDRLYTSTFP